MAKKKTSVFETYDIPNRVNSAVLYDLECQLKSKKQIKLAGGFEVTKQWLKAARDRITEIYKTMEQYSSEITFARMSFQQKSPERCTLLVFEWVRKGILVSYYVALPDIYDNLLFGAFDMTAGECIEGFSNVMQCVGSGALPKSDYDPNNLGHLIPDAPRFVIQYKKRLIAPWKPKIAITYKNCQSVNPDIPNVLSGYEVKSDSCTIMDGNLCLWREDGDLSIKELDSVPMTLEHLCVIEKSYREGDSDFVLPDSEFDELRNVLGITEEEVQENEEVINPILSLEKCRTIDDIKKFVERVAGHSATWWVISDKMDGCALRLIYNGVTGALLTAFTKGKRRDVSNLAKLLAEAGVIPAVLNFSGNGKVKSGYYKTLEITGELCASDRKIVAGLLGLKSPTKENITGVDGLTFLAYDSATMSDYTKCAISNDIRASRIQQEKEMSYFEQMLLEIKMLGFNIVPHVSKSQQSMLMLVRECLEARNSDCLHLSAKYKTLPTDGIVIRVDNNDLFKKAGATSHHPRGAIAIKFEEDWQPVTVQEKSVVMGTNNVQKVVIKFAPVTVNNRNITSATAQFTGADNVEIGQSVLVCLRGKVIPVWRFA